LFGLVHHSSTTAHTPFSPVTRLVFQPGTFFNNSHLLLFSPAVSAFMILFPRRPFLGWRLLYRTLPLLRAVQPRTLRRMDLEGHMHLSHLGLLKSVSPFCNSRLDLRASAFRN